MAYTLYTPLKIRCRIRVYLTYNKVKAIKLAILQSIFLSVFWLTLRHKQNRARNSEGELYRVIGITIQTLLATYSILASCGALLIVSLHGQPTIYQIIYMFLFLLLTVTYKVLSDYTLIPHFLSNIKHFNITNE